MKISLIAAMTPERVIGIDNHLPWHLPVDLAWFKQHTLHKPLLMGRKTYHSIGRSLPHRHNIVLSHQPIAEPSITWAKNLPEGLAASGNASELMVIGGGMLYQQLLDQADRLYLSLVDAHLAGTTYFPDYTQSPWLVRLSHYHPADIRNPYGCRFLILDRQRL